jgi:transposase
MRVTRAVSGYSRFLRPVSLVRAPADAVMHQHHEAGDKLFVDYSGKKVPIVDPHSGEVREAEIFVGVMGAAAHPHTADDNGRTRAQVEA